MDMNTSFDYFFPVRFVGSSQRKLPLREGAPASWRAPSARVLLQLFLGLEIAFRLGLAVAFCLERRLVVVAERLELMEF
jgi:hypothetical protein